MNLQADVRRSSQNQNQNFLNVVTMGLFAAAVILAGTSNAFGIETGAPEASTSATEPGPGTRAGDREKFHAAMEVCVAETGVSKPAKGVRPSAEDRKKIDDCLAAKGISKPEGGHRGHHGKGYEHGRKGGRPPGPPLEDDSKEASGSSAE